jgi:hypothetical protein
MTYPLAGWLGAKAGMPVTLAVLGALTLVAIAAAAVLWPASDPDVVEHAHPDLESGPSAPCEGVGRGRHAHAFVIDDLHQRWPDGPAGLRPGTHRALPAERQGAGPKPCAPCRPTGRAAGCGEACSSPDICV